MKTLEEKDASQAPVWYSNSEAESWASGWNAARRTISGPASILQYLREQVKDHRARAIERGPGTRENNPRVAQYLEERAQAIEQATGALEEALKAVAVKFGYVE